MTLKDILLNEFSATLSVLSPQLRRSITILFFIMLGLAVAEVASLLGLTFFATVLANPQNFGNSIVSRLILRTFPNFPIPEDPRTFVLIASCVPIFFIGIKNAFYAVVTWKTSVLGENVAAYIGETILKFYLYQPYSWHISSLSGDAMTKMGWRSSVGSVLIQTLIVYSNFTTAIFLFGCLLISSPFTTLVVIGVMFVASLTTYKLLRNKIDSSSRLSAGASQREGIATMAAMRGIREVLIYGRQKEFIHGIFSNVLEGIPYRAFLNTAPPVPTWVLETSGFLLIGVTLFFLICVADSDMTKVTSTIALLTLAAWRVLPSLNRVVGAIIIIRSQQYMSKECLEYVKEVKSSKSQIVSIEPDKLFKINTKIELKNISFTYPNASSPSLFDISFSLKVGESVGLIGKSGAGKSTLINILSGLLVPTQGNLLVDSKELTPAQLAAFRQQVGYVPQTPYIMPGTVAKNVAFSDWGKTINRKKVEKACKLAAVDFLNKKLGIDHPVGENGAGLSGGQAQRISIARAFYVNPSIVIFDEATSALDEKNESIIQDSIEGLSASVITVIAAHRLSTIEKCSKIIWLENGKLVALGKPKQILSKYVHELNREGHSI